MPSVSKKQHNLMAMVAHDPAAAKRVGIPQSVGKDFSHADKGKKFKGGGNVEKESKAMAHAEMVALKRGHAPKSVMEHERKEHSEMGYKHGGSVETSRTGYGMKDDEHGSRKAPHMDKKALPKESTPLKGYGMKKGGHVKHHTKHLKRGGSAAPMARPKRRPAVNPAALAAMAGPSGAPPGPMGPGPGGMPGMAHGGGVQHHHHHYYGGGHVGPGAPTTPGPEGILKGKSKHGDGAAKRGHTKGKVR